jgi:hypothetical protein
MYDHQLNEYQLGEALSVATADPIAAARPAFPGRFPMTIQSIWATTTTAVTVANAVLTFKVRPTPGSAAGEVVLGTLTLPTAGSAAGNLYWKDITPVKVNPGSQIVVSASGGAAGNAAIGFTARPQWEQPENNTKAFASA